MPRRSATVSREPPKSRTSAPGSEARCSSTDLRRQGGFGFPALSAHSLHANADGSSVGNQVRAEGVEPPWAEARRLLRPVRLAYSATPARISRAPPPRPLAGRAVRASLLRRAGMPRRQHAPLSVVLRDAAQNPRCAVGSNRRPLRCVGSGRARIPRLRRRWHRGARLRVGRARSTPRGWTRGCVRH